MQKLKLYVGRLFTETFHLSVAIYTRGFQYIYGNEAKGAITSLVHRNQTAPVTMEVAIRRIVVILSVVVLFLLIPTHSNYKRCKMKSFVSAKDNLQIQT